MSSNTNNKKVKASFTGGSSIKSIGSSSSSKSNAGSSSSSVINVVNKSATDSTLGSYVSTSSSNASSGSSSLGSSNASSYWLPPISSLLSSIDYMDGKKAGYYNAPPPQLPQGKRRKRMHIKPSTMPMIPYYFHHKDFGIEACMLQLEAQAKFNNYYYL